MYDACTIVLFKGMRILSTRQFRNKDNNRLLQFASPPVSQRLSCFITFLFWGCQTRYAQCI